MLIFAAFPVFPGQTALAADAEELTGISLRILSGGNAWSTNGAYENNIGSKYIINPSLVEVTDMAGNEVELEITTSGNTILNFKGINIGEAELAPIVAGQYSFNYYLGSKDDTNLVSSALFELTADNDVFWISGLILFIMNTSGEGLVSEFEVLNNQLEPIKPIAERNMNASGMTGMWRDYVVLSGINYTYTVVPPDLDYNIMTGTANIGSVGMGINFTLTHALNVITTIKVTKNAEVGVYYKAGKHFTAFTSFPLTKDEGMSDADSAYDYYTTKLPPATELHYEAVIPGVSIKQSCRFRVTVGQTPTITIDLPLLTAPFGSLPSAWMENDLYTNADDSGSINLNTGGSFKLDTIRVWQAMSGQTSNYFIDPLYDFQIVGDENISLSRSGTTGRDRTTINANTTGVSVIKITYGPLRYSYVAGTSVNEGDGHMDFPAIDPVNTGIIVINVNGGTEIDTGITARNDFDTYYYNKNTSDHVRYTFTPSTQDVRVRVHKPIHDGTGVEWDKGWSEYYRSNDDGSFTIALYEGGNIVEVSTETGVRYHVIDAKGIDVNITNTSNPHQPFAVGDTVRISFNGLKMPIQKIGGIYNPGFPDTAYVVYENALGGDVRGPGTQYDFIVN